MTHLILLNLLEFINTCLPGPRIFISLSAMSRKARQELPAASYATAFSKGITRALNFAPRSSASSSTSENSSDSHRDELVHSSSAEQNAACAILRKALSFRSVVSTSSSLAERMNRARVRATHAETEYRMIGTGSCGTVFKITGTEFAFKKGSDIQSMWNDFNLTNTVHNAMNDTREMLQDAFPNRTIPQTPQCLEFLLPDSKDFWDETLGKIPISHREVGAAFVVDRILPLPEHIREALIELFFDEAQEAQQKAKMDQANKHCLVRIYLGERESETQAEAFYDSLQNFPLRLNMIEQIKLDKFSMAKEMAMSLAVLHWKAHVDAMDVEFVLGSTAETLPNRRKAYTAASDPNGPLIPCEVKIPHKLNFKHRSTHLWVLDFDKATHIELTPNDVEKKLVPAFLGNDPYYPRPDVDEHLWESFSKTYLTASTIILANRQERASVMRLPKLFLDKVADMIKEHEDWDPEEHIVFGQ